MIAFFYIIAEQQEKYCGYPQRSAPLISDCGSEFFKKNDVRPYISFETFTAYYHK